MRRDTPVRIAIVGCGQITETHISSLLKTAHVELVAACDADGLRARKTAERFHVPAYHTDLTDALRKERIDATHIVTPPYTHPALSIQAMNAGCHVLVEKPMALNLADADRMVEAARVNRVRLCVAHNKLFNPVVSKARSIVARHVIGELTAMNMTLSELSNSPLVMEQNHWCHRLPGGVFSEILPHPLYLASAFLGRLDVAQVYSRKIGSHDWLPADELRVILEGKSSVAEINLSLNGPRDIMAFDIIGTKGALHVSLLNGVLIKYTPVQRNRFSHGLESVSTAWQWLAGTASTTLTIAVGRYHTGHPPLIQRFVESLQCDTKPPVTAEESREVVRLHEMIASRMNPGLHHKLLA